jgi:MFS family permease
MKPFIMVASLLQRLVYLVAALALLFLAGDYPSVALLVAAFAPFFAGSIGGTNLSAWLELVARIIPADRLASSWAIRKIITALIGIFAGGIVKSVLESNPGAEGFGRLHLYAFAGLMASYVIFAMIRETKPFPPHPDKPCRTLLANIRSLPALIRENPPFRNFIRVKLLTLGIYIPAPFLALHALDTTGQGPGFLGELVTAQMTGAITGNLLAGWLGDRRGSRLLLIIARLALISLCLGAVFAETPWAFIALFFLFGFGMNFNEVGEATLTLELVPRDRRPTCVAILAALALPGTLTVALIGALLRGLTHSLLPAAALGGVLLILSLATTLRIQEPRRFTP